MLNAFFISGIIAWQWFFAIGVALMLLELCIPAFFLLWIGIACLATAVIQVLFDLSTLGQTLCFSFFAIISLSIGYFNYARKSSQNQVQASINLNNRTEQILGEILTLEKDIFSTSSGHAKIYVSINDTRWVVGSVNGLPLSADQQVRVVAIKGNILMVENISDN